jgi:uncharacterized protein YqjF (DUF2071 family)
MFTFLSCEWRKLAIANYVVDPAVLQKYLPFKTRLDHYNGLCYVSLVGFMFLDTKALGVKIPYHINFEEVNLRFYVTYDNPDESRRGVVFIKEIVPRPALAFFARTLYGENYVALPMGHQWVQFGRKLEVDYQWKLDQWNAFKIQADAQSVPIEPGSDQEFFFEHYWGYTRINDKKTFEYKVEHPRWEVYPVNDFKIQVEFGKLYGNEFEFLSHLTPSSVFLAEGSAVKIKSKTTIC